MSVFMHSCAHMCVCLSAWFHVHVGVTLEQAQSLNISDCFPHFVSLCVVVCVLGCFYKCLVGDGCLICLLYACVCVCVGVFVCVCVYVWTRGASTLPCPLLPMLYVLSPGSTLSAQSVPTMYPGQLAVLAPGGLANSGSSTLLQPLKPSPSSNNLCSAYTSEGALSVPSLCAPTPGRTSACTGALTSFPTTWEVNCNMTRMHACWFVLTPSRRDASLFLSLCV